jgi:tetratricopeptide (TPR) repeat protein
MSDMVNSHLAHISGLEKRFGPESAEVAIALGTLARLICQYNEPADAAPYFKRSIAIRQTIYGPETILSDLDNWINQKNPVSFDVLEPFILQRLEIRATILGEADPRVAVACDAIAAEYLQHTRYAEARTFLERSLAIKQRASGAYSAAVAATLKTLVEVCLRASERQQADRYLERCNEVTETVFGARSQEVARTLVSLAVSYVSSSKLQRRSIKTESRRRAWPMFESGLSINEAVFGPDSLEVQKSLEAMARACLDSGEFWEAEPLLTRLLSVCEQIYGDDAAALLWILTEMAQGYADQQSEKAEQALQRSFDILRTLLDARKPTFRDAIADLPGDKAVLYSGSRTGLLEKLVRTSETVRRNSRRRWGAPD